MLIKKYIFFTWENALFFFMFETHLYKNILKNNNNGWTVSNIVRSLNASLEAIKVSIQGERWLGGLVEAQR